MVNKILQVCVVAAVVAQVFSLNSIQERKPGCRPTADVIFLIDGSDSISDQEFNQQREFIRRFIQNSDVGQDAIRVGITVVSTTIGDEVPLSMNSTKDDILKALNGLTQPQEGTRTDLGLVEMERLFSADARRGVSRVGVVLTDGRAKYIRATEAEARVVKDAGVFLVAVGVGRLIKFHELEKLSSTKSNAYSLEPLDLSTKYLTETVNFLGQESCAGLQLVNRLGVTETAKPVTNETVTVKLNLDLATLSGRSVTDTTLPKNDPVGPGPLPMNMKPNVPFGREQMPLGLLGLNLNQPTLNLPMSPLGFGSINTDIKTMTKEDMVNAALQAMASAVVDLSTLTALSAKASSKSGNNTVTAKTVNPLTDVGYNILTTAGTGLPTDASLLDSAMYMVESSSLTSDVTGQSTPTDTPPVAQVTPQVIVNALPVTEAPKQALINYEEMIPGPTETANIIIQSLLVRMNNTKPHPPQKPMPKMGPGRALGPFLPSDAGLNSAVGVKVHFQNNSAADTLDFLKKRIKPPRTVEEHLNPIFRMFDGGPGQNRPQPKLEPEKIATPAPVTTMSPQEAYKRAQMSALRDQCSKGRFVDGIAYTFKPGSCTKFLQCFKEGNGIQVRVATCPFETFFDDQHSVCRHHEDQMCWTDPCADKVTMSYGHESNCRAYWSCERGHSAPVCCPSGTSYVSGYGCARNVTCTDPCMDFGNLKAVTQASKCKLLALDVDPQYYFEHVAGMGWLVRMCPQGSKFEQVYCKCTGSKDVSVDKCTPELHMDFQGGVVDISGNNLAMGVYNVDLDGGTAAFYGNSHLKLWRFSGMSLGQHVMISFRFRTSVTAIKGKLMHLVSNCCLGCQGPPQPSLDIAIIPGDQGGVAVFSTTTREAGETFLFVPFKDTFTGWNKLSYSYDGLRMKGEVNGQTAQKPIVGDIIAKPDPLLIGACGLNNAYDGFMDEFKFYMCTL